MPRREPENEAIELSDADIIIRMLYLCERPRPRSQIVYHCSIDLMRFTRISEHCLKRGILRLARIDPEREYFITDRGKEVLKSAQEITRALGIDSDLNTSLR